MDSIDKLTELFRHFPGIGPRQARRFVYYLLNEPLGTTDDLIKELQALKNSVATCSMCFRYFPLSEAKDESSPLCSICRNPNRDHSTLMIVSRDIDLQAMEKSRAFNGVYFVLGGSIPLLEEHPERKVRKQELLNRISNIPQGNLKEIILATSVNPEGEHTAQYVYSSLQQLAREKEFKISTLGRGLSTGTEIEYSDSDTIKSALENRR